MVWVPCDRILFAAQVCFCNEHLQWATLDKETLLSRRFDHAIEHLSSKGLEHDCIIRDRKNRCSTRMHARWIDSAFQALNVDVENLQHESVSLAARSLHLSSMSGAFLGLTFPKRRALTEQSTRQTSIVESHASQQTSNCTGRPTEEIVETLCNA